MNASSSSRVEKFDVRMFGSFGAKYWPCSRINPIVRRHVFLLCLMFLWYIVIYHLFSLWLIHACWKAMVWRVYGNYVFYSLTAILLFYIDSDTEIDYENTSE